MKARITDRNVGTFTEIEVLDTMQPGLALWCGKKKRTWFLRAKMRGTDHRVKLGSYPALTIAEAREACRLEYRRLERGEEKPEPKKEPAPELTLGEMIDAYEAFRRGQGGKGMKSLAEAVKTLRKNFGPMLARPVREIGKHQIRAVRDQIAERGAATMSNRFLAYAGPAFRWAAMEDHIEGNPLANVPRRLTEQPRHRVLTDEEIRLLWEATGKAAQGSYRAYARLVRFLLVTGQRLNEASAMTREDVTDGIWTQTANKAARRHLVPLSGLALAVMGEDASGLVFRGVSGRLSGWSKFKDKLDAESGVTGWRHHDLRRTCATGLQSLGVDRDVIAVCLNQQIIGVAGTHYMRADMAPQKAAALEQWAAKVRGIVNHENVIVAFG